jgi:uncharacterized iron-regulated membrane protein
MLSRFDRTNRIRATIALVIAYAFCVLAPHAALAFTGGSLTMHCLTELSDLADVHQAAAAPVAHTHADGTTHMHGAPKNTPMHMAQHKHGDGNTHDHGKPGKADDGNCCGLFCLSALNHDGVAALPSPPPAARTKAAPEPERASRDPDRIDEPPIG